MIIKESVGCSVSIAGVITNAKGEEVKQSVIRANGIEYAVVYLPVGNEYNHVMKCFYVHRLVAQYWLTRPDSGTKWVRHKDGNRLNNKAFNLEWYKRSTNKRASNGRQDKQHTQKSKTKISASLKGSKHPKFKGQYICNFKSYDSATEAARWLKTTAKTVIHRCKSGKMKDEGWYFVASK